MKKENFKSSNWAGWILVCSMLLTGWLVVACSDDDTVIPDPFTVDLSFSSIAKDTTLTFTAYGDWEASVNKSDMVEIKSAKSGVGGEVKMKISLLENKTLVPREAEILINDGRKNTFRIQQLAGKRNVNFSKVVSFTQDKTEFTDVVVITSNVVWEVATMPEWVKSWKKADESQMPEDGVETSISLVFVADNNKLTPAAMNGEITFKDKAGNTYPLPVEFVGFTPSITYDTDELILSKSETGEGFRGKVIVTSNVAWSVDKAQADFVGKITYDATTLGNALESEVVVWVDVAMEKLNTEGLSGKLIFADELTGKSVPLKVKFTGTGDSYIRFEREKILNQKLDATPFDANFELLPNARMSIDFDVFAPQGKNCSFVLVGYNGSKPYKLDPWMPWVRVDEKIDENALGTRVPIVGKTYTLMVNDRRQEWGDGKELERHAILFVVPENVSVDDILETTDTGETDQWGEPIYTYEFKNGYSLEKGVLFHQKGLEISD